ncbi:MAG: phytoene/squalene synthase family protein [Sphaerochaeta sp.]
MVADRHEHIFRNGSKTYYFSSRFFPPQVRRDVYALYGFVRVADNLVDDQPVDPDRFHTFRKTYIQAYHSGTSSGDEVIDAFIELQRRKHFDPAWTEAFLDSMEHDLSESTCETLEDVLTYIYGSAEVIGLFMARIMDLEEASFPYAAMLGRAMQYINFIRDIAEDNGLGRRYLPWLTLPCTHCRSRKREKILENSLHSSIGRLHATKVGKRKLRKGTPTFHDATVFPS